MAITRAAIVLAPLLLLSVGAAVIDEEVLLAADDECLASDEGCEMSLRQLRASGKEAKDPTALAKPSEKETSAVAKHEHEQAKQASQPAAAQLAPVVDAVPKTAQVSLADANATVAGSCSSDDEGKLVRLGGGNADGTFPKITASCGREAYSWFSFHPDRMRSCMVQRTGISGPCADCFVAAGQYGVDHCKLQCLFGSWCGKGCLNCNSQGNNNAKQCAGVNVPPASFC